MIGNMASDSNSFDSENEYDNKDSDLSSEEETQANVLDKNSDQSNSKSKGLANVMMSILNKQTSSSKIILSKAQTDKERALNKVEKRKFEEDTNNINEDTESGTVSFFKQKVRKLSNEQQSESDENEDTTIDPRDGKEKLLKKKAWENMARIKPDAADKTREKNLQRIATKGVVQLFNAVKQQQNLVNDMIEEAGPSERKKDKALKSISKGQFIDMLKGTTDKQSSEAAIKKEKKQSKKLQHGNVHSVETAGNEKPSWSILRDDFMMGAKMKDWDKESDDDNYNEVDSNEDSFIET